MFAGDAWTRPTPLSLFAFEGSCAVGNNKNQLLPCLYANANSGRLLCYGAPHLSSRVEASGEARGAEQTETRGSHESEGVPASRRMRPPSPVYRTRKVIPAGWSPGEVAVR